MIDLRKLRFDNGRITQAELSKASGVNRATISEIESKGRIPSVKTAKKLCDYFGISLSDIYKEGGLNE